MPGNNYPHLPEALTEAVADVCAVVNGYNLDEIDRLHVLALAIVCKLERMGEKADTLKVLDELHRYMKEEMGG